MSPECVSVVVLVVTRRFFLPFFFMFGHFLRRDAAREVGECLRLPYLRCKFFVARRPTRLYHLGLRCGPPFHRIHFHSGTYIHTRTPAMSLPSSCSGRFLSAVGLCPHVALLFSLLCSLMDVGGFRRTKCRLVVVRAVIGDISLLPLLLVSCFTHVLCLVGVCLCVCVCVLSVPPISSSYEPQLFFGRHADGGGRGGGGRPPPDTVRDSTCGGRALLLQDTASVDPPLCPLIRWLCL